MRTKQFIIKFVILFSFTLINFIISAKSLSFRLEDRDYFVVVAKKGDTLFGIARDKNWNDSILSKFNPELISPLKQGDKVVYPAIDIYSQENNLKDSLTLSRPYDKTGKDVRTSIISYKISSSDTLKEISEKFNVSVSSIFELNPGLTPDNFKIENSIRIPIEGTGIRIQNSVIKDKSIESFSNYILENDESWDTIAKKFNIDSNLLMVANPDIIYPKKKNTLLIPKVSNTFREIQIPIRDDRENSIEGIKQIYKDTHNYYNKVTDRINITVVTESPYSKRDIEFIRGFLTALKNFNYYGISFKVIDGSLSEDESLPLLQENDPDIIFFTSEKQIPDYISDFIKDKNIPLINVFDIKNKDYIGNPNIVQLLSQPSYFNELVAKKILSDFSDYSLIFIGEEDPNDALAQELKKLWNNSYIENLSELATKEFDLKPLNKVIFYSYSNKKDDVSSLLMTVFEIAENNPLSDLKVLGRPNWILFDESLRKELQDVNAMIPSRFYIDESSDKAKDFYNGYNDLYNGKPLKSFPLFAATGYDVANYFIPAMFNNHFDLNYFKPEFESIQSGFNLKRNNYWEGFLNLPVYLVKYFNNGTVKRIVIE